MPVLVPVINAESMSFLPCVLRHRILPTDWPARGFPHSTVIWREMTPRRPTALGASKNSKCPAPSNVSISLVEISDVQTFACSTGVMRSLVPHRIRVGTLIHFSHRLSFGSYSLSQTIRASDVNSRYRPTLMSTVKSVLGIRANASGDETM